MERYDYCDHPGYDAQGCEHSIKIDPHPYGMSSRGFACYLTGGHCLPNSEACPLTQGVEEYQEP